MDLDMLVRGVVLGFGIAAPVGPIGVLCIRRTIADGRMAGFLSGMGAATADGVYGAIAAFGVTALMDALVGVSAWLRLLGGLYLCYLGLRTFFAPPAASAAPARAGSLATAYAATCILTLTNPMTIISFVAIFAGVGGAADGEAARNLVAGVFLGSALWWLLLSGGVGLVRERLPSTALRIINRASGVIILSFGLIALFGVL